MPTDMAGNGIALFFKRILSRLEFALIWMHQDVFLV
jgi:hypothetical protein